MDQNLNIDKRYHVKRREVKEILKRLTTTIRNIDYASFNKNMEAVEINSKGRVYLINRKPLFIDTETEIFPTLLNQEILTQLPTLRVDRGAVPHLCNGADLMAPGIVKMIGEFHVKEIAVVVDEGFSKPIALVKMLYGSKEMSEKNKGKVAKNLHYVGDRFWKAFKLIK